ncbi:MAG: biotin-dependent carboxyltransferase family protein [Pseudomonadota bacterium]
MTTARLTVLRTGPLVTIQDGGRFGHARFGVPASGPMDRFSFSLGQHAAANPRQASEVPADSDGKVEASGAALEVSLAGIDLVCSFGSLTLAATGLGFRLKVNDCMLASPAILTLNEADTFSLRPGVVGSWGYIAFAGELDRPSWLASRATHLLSGFGGGVVQTGDTLTIHSARCEPRLDGPMLAEVPGVDAAAPSDDFRVVLGPQQEFFSPSAQEALLSAPFTLTDAYDRMGVRLNGPSIEPLGDLSLPSQAIVRGSIQVAGDGVATVLLADHQTTGGYPKIATVIEADLDRFAQKRAGETVTFSAVTPAEAIRLTRVRAAEIAAIYATARDGGGSLDARLMTENLIGGVVDGAKLEN